MLPTLVFSAALALGQADPARPAAPAEAEPPMPQYIRSPAEVGEPPMPQYVRSAADAVPNLMFLNAQAPDAGVARPVEIIAPVAPVPAAPAAAAAAPTAAAADRWMTMRALQGTWLGSELDGHRLSFSGWTEMSYTASTASVSNQPVVWNDRANQFLLQQQWFRFERSVVTSGTTDPTWGFRLDVLTGSDYRFSLPRGLFQDQLLNSTGAQNLYGVDPIQHYVNLYVPTLFRGTEFRFGRLYTPWGLESLEAVSTPLPSRSYAFNWSPPFTHFGLGAYTTITPEWSTVLMLVNGNDVYIGDSSQEIRTVGNIQWKQPGGRNTATVAWSVGRGKFNAGAPFAPATIGLATEPLGRNNFNAFDLVYQHFFNPVFSYQMEAIYAYQTAAPNLFTADGFGNANWFAAAHYLFYQASPRLTAILRYENFEDSVGQRTGFPGLYTAITGGLTWKIRKDVWFRPELRYDYNSIARPFEGQHDLFTADADVVIRW